MQIAFTRSGERSLARVPVDRQRQILARLKALAADPTSRSIDVRPLAGSDLFRLRVGDYRVLFSLNEAHGILTVELIRTRGDVYKR
jgi:mRNA interferase RelE/StbE